MLATHAPLYLPTSGENIKDRDSLGECCATSKEHEIALGARCEHPDRSTVGARPDERAAEEDSPNIPMHCHYCEKEGYTSLTKNMKSLKLIELGIVRLKRNDGFKERIGDKEAVLVILEGKCSIKTKSHSFPQVGKRKNPFAGKATAVYLPPYTNYDIVGKSDCEIAVCKVKAKRRGKPVLITPDKVRLKKVGKDNFKRDVYNIVNGKTGAEHILVGETINRKGNWSSYPPHKHDKDNLPFESKQEELYFFKLEPADGFGIMRLYNGKNDEVFTIKNNDVVAIPRGYHPVGVIPGYRIYYLWILAGKKRILKPKDDPRYSWVK